MAAAFTCMPVVVCQCLPLQLVTYDACVADPGLDEGRSLAEPSHNIGDCQSSIRETALSELLTTCESADLQHAEYMFDNTVMNSLDQVQTFVLQCALLAPQQCGFDKQKARSSRI